VTSEGISASVIPSVFGCEPRKEPRRQGWLRWLGRQMIPNIGTLLMVVVLLLTIPSACLISYQGRLADADGNPITGKVNIEFRLYDVPTGGVPLWEEFWTGGNAVDVSDGLFSVMLGGISTHSARSPRLEKEGWGW